jgi:uncharacterized protein YaiI (UPF0178 family)
MTLQPTDKIPESAETLTIWIDADAAPRDVKEIVFRASSRLNLPVRLVANQSIFAPPSGGRVECIVVPDGANAADRYIVEQAVAGDIVITADIPLAAQLVDRHVWVVDPRGEVMDDGNVRSRLASRNLMDAARGSGMEISGPPPYSLKDKGKFASALDRVLTKAIRSRAQAGSAGSKVQFPD